MPNKKQFKPTMTQITDQEREFLKACVTGDFALVKRAIKNGVNIEVRDSFNSSALCNAISWQRKNIIKLLLDNGANPNPTETSSHVALALVGRQGDVEVLKWLLDAGADINALEKSTGFTALTATVLMGKIPALKFLLEQGADPDRHLIGRVTPMHEAVVMGRVDALELLIKANADPGALNYAKKTPLQSALEKKNEAIIELCRLSETEYRMRQFKENRSTASLSKKSQTKKFLKLKRRVSRKGIGNG